MANFKGHFFCVCLIILGIVYGAPIDETEPNAFAGTTPEENVNIGLVEGDIALGPQGRNVINNPDLKWPGGVVYYEIYKRHYSASDISIINSAMAEISSKTCIKFVARTTQADYVYISSKSGCYSYIGRIKGRQDVSLQNPGCVYKGTIVHELVHALGIWHEQSRYDRDSYIQVILANVMRGQERNFDKLTQATTQTFGFPYDYASIMHYASTSFSRDGRKATILTKPPGITIGQRTALSNTDIGKIKKLYACPT